MPHRLSRRRLRDDAVHAVLGQFDRSFFEKLQISRASLRQIQSDLVGDLGQALGDSSPSSANSCERRTRSRCAV
jgi:hypothetical protein